MTPSNPTNGQPFIYRIMDALGVKHQVVPVEHSHRELVGDSISLFVGGTEIEIEPSDVPNLLRALSDPDSVPTANSNKLVTSGGVKTALDGKQDTITFDTTPTANSTNPVTSGGVKAAIDDATKAVFGSMPYYITAAHEKMKVHTCILRNNTGSTIKLTECIDVSALPAAERHVYWNSPDIDLPNNTEIGIRFVRTSNAIFLYYDGNFDY